MVTAIVVIVIVVLLFLLGQFISVRLYINSSVARVAQSLPDWGAMSEEALRPTQLLRQQRRQARAAFPTDMLELARGVAHLLDPVEDALQGEAWTLYRQAKEEIRTAWIDFRVPGPWAVQTVRTYQRRHHAQQTRRTAQILKVS